MSSEFGSSLHVLESVTAEGNMVSAGGLGHGFTDVAQSSYNASGNEGSLGVSHTTTAAVTINLPEISTMDAPYRMLVIADFGLNAATNNITVVPGGSDTIAGITGSGLIDDDGGVVRLVSNGDTQWFVA